MEFFMDFLPRLWLIGLQPTYFFMESCSEKGFFLPFCTLLAYFPAWFVQTADFPHIPMAAGKPST